MASTVFSVESYTGPRNSTHKGYGLNDMDAGGYALPNAQELHFHISQVLQTSLRLSDILHLFFMELHRFLEVDSLSYRNKHLCSKLDFGQCGTHRCHKRLEINDHYLGDLILGRDLSFSDEDLKLIDSLVDSLICPIRNALLYEDALQAALEDPLTEVGNRAAFETTFERDVSLAHRHKQSLSLLVIDIDFFKNINDDYGHSVGDQVLQNVAKTLTDCCRESDVCYRYGGEEFVVILNQTDKYGSQLIAERIRQSILRSSVRHHQKTITVTASIGIGTLKTHEDPKELFERADQALYRAKESGRNQVATAS